MEEEKNMQGIAKIASFKVDHTKITPGFYISRIDGTVVTYDLRTRKPNCGNYMDNITMHSVEHMFATLVRSSDIGKDVLYFGPMGCQTGFYLLVKDVSPQTVFAVTIETIRRILEYDGPVFGASVEECGNYKNLSLESAKKELKAYLEVLLRKGGASFDY